MNKRIIVIKEPVPGIWGIHRLYVYGQVKEKFNPQSDEELYVVFYNKSYTRLKLMHVDATGYDLTTRILFSGKFSTDGKPDNLENLTEKDLRRLFIDGSLPNTSYQNPLSKIYLTLLSNSAA